MSTVSRVRHRARTYLSESPAYLPVARRRHPGPSPQVIEPETELVIDGYTRCGSTHTVYAFQVAQPEPVRLAHHLHATAQVLAAVRRGVPALVVIRDPRAAVLSQLVREPTVDVRDALIGFARFYELLEPHRSAVVGADFPELLGDLGGVVARVNRRFGTRFACPDPTADVDDELRELVSRRSTLSPVLLGFETGLVTLERVREEVARVPRPAAGAWVPTPEREAAKAALAEVWTDAPQRLVRRAQDAYSGFVASEPQ